MKRVKELGGASMLDLTYLRWDDGSERGSSFGMLNKAEIFLDDATYYFKLSRMQGSTFVGYESIIEYLVSRYLDILGVPHVSYDLLMAKVALKGKVYNTLVSMSKDYKCSEEEAIPVQMFCPDQPQAEQLLRNTFGHSCMDIYYLVDFLIANSDRHGHNIEIAGSESSQRLSPLFDHGNSLLYWATYSGAVMKYDVMQDIPTNNYVGSESLYTNLEHITSPVVVTPITSAARAAIFYKVGPKIMPQQIIDKTWEMIWRRYCYARDKGFLIERSTLPAEASSHFNSNR